MHYELNHGRPDQKPDEQGWEGLLATGENMHKGLEAWDSARWAALGVGADKVGGADRDRLVSWA